MSRRRIAPKCANRRLRSGLSRRRFIGHLIAGPTLLAAAELTTADARAAIPTVQLVDHYDLSDLLNEAALPTSALITVGVNNDGTVSFARRGPRSDRGSQPPWR